MSFILIAWSFFCLIFAGIPCSYLIYLRHFSLKSWDLKVDRTHVHQVTIMIPTHNEEKTIGLKLENLSKLNYPPEKMQILIVDDASTDKTREEVLKFVNHHPEFNICILGDAERRGKAKALNFALKHVNHELIVVSDADTFWAPDILEKALPYLTDPSIGAIAGRERVLDYTRSWNNLSEKSHFGLMYDIIGVGESKIHSTIFWHGAFAVYKKEFLSEFNLELDDSGTALDIVQKGGRTILVPEANCFSVITENLKGKISTKVRRAKGLVKLWAKCFRLMLNRKLSLPKRIAVPEIFLYLINPLIFLLLGITSFFLILENLSYSLVFLLLLAFVLLVRRSRFVFMNILQNYCILLLALLGIFSKSKLAWETIEEPLTRAMLEREGLV